MKSIHVTINDQLYGPISVDPEIMMLSFLHEYINLTGTKFGCGKGICHACVVIVDNEDGTSETMRTCITNAIAFDGKKIRTLEGHAKKNALGEIIALHPVQEAFITHFSFQCGWCTSGFTNETIALLEKLKTNPIKVEDVESVMTEALGEHICRCTGYVKYYEAVKSLILSTKGLTR